MLTGSPERFANDVGGFLSPDEGSRVLIPVVDVVVDVSDETLDGFEGASTNGLAGEDSEPGLDHVEPRRPLGGEVELNPRVGLKPLLDGGCGVCGRVVENDVKVAFGIGASQAFHEGEEVISVVCGGAFTDHTPARDFESGVEARESIAAIVVGASLGKTGSDRKHRLSPGKGLNLSLFIHAEHDCIGRRLQVQADDVTDPFFGIGIGRELKGGHLVWLERVSSPNAVNRRVGNASPFREVARAPMGRPRPYIGRLERQSDDLCSFALGDRRWTPRSRPLLQPVESSLREAASDPAHLNHGVSDFLRSLRPRHTIGHQEDCPGSPGQTSWSRGTSSQSLKLATIPLAQNDGAGLPGHGFRAGECHGIY